MNPSYQLSSTHTLVDRSVLPAKGYAGGLLNRDTGEVLLLNAEFYQLLQLFQQAASVNDAIHLFAPLVQALPVDIRPLLETTLSGFVKEGILIPSEQSTQPKSENPFSLEPQSWIGSYQIQAELSITPPVGIYLVKNQRGQRYVLKKLFIHKNTPKQVTQAQQREFAYEFALLKHFSNSRYITHFVEFNAEEQVGVISYFAGQKLHRYQETNSESLSLSMRLDLLWQLLCGMDQLHKKGVLHGDLHTSNILVNKNNKLRIIDFDLALFQKDRYKQMLRYGGIVDFIPPERLSDDVFHQLKHIPTFRAEVYQIGVLAYFILQDKLPFVRATWREQITAIRHDYPVWNQDIPTELTQLIGKALHKKPRHRFASAAEMRKALWQVLQTKRKKTAHL
jgi:eukaryotic-like serine/threonine-protein kinase